MPHGQARACGSFSRGQENKCPQVCSSQKGGLGPGRGVTIGNRPPVPLLVPERGQDSPAQMTFHQLWYLEEQMAFAQRAIPQIRAKRIWTFLDITGKFRLVINILWKFKTAPSKSNLCLRMRFQKQRLPQAGVSMFFCSCCLQVHVVLHSPVLDYLEDNLQMHK